MREQQCTLDRSISLVGIGLHSGITSTIVLKPASIGHGIRFLRTDLDGGRASLIPALAASVFSTKLGTRIENADGGRVGTIEHLMAALATCGVDNVLIEIDGPEVPILDGSSAPFVAAIDRVGLAVQPAPRRFFQPSEVYQLVEGDRHIIVEPGDRRELEVSIEFDDPAVGQQSIALDLDDPEQLRSLNRARTFCQLSEVKSLQAEGLCKGGALDNAIVIDDGKVLNPEGLRMADEFVRHKALDLIGDLNLLGGMLIGRIIARKPGHDLNTRFAAMLCQAWEEQRSVVSEKVFA